MDRGSAGALTVGVIVVAAAAALFLGVLGGSTATTFTDDVPFEAIPTDGSAIVFSRAEEGGLEVIGVRLQRPSYTLDVGLAVPHECVIEGGTDELLSHDGRCGELPVHGPVVGGGITRSGERVVTVRIPVSEACSEAISLGAPWPPAASECAGAASPR